MEIEDRSPKSRWVPIVVGTLVGAALGGALMLWLDAESLDVSPVLVLGPLTGLGAFVGLNIAVRRAEQQL